MLFIMYIEDVKQKQQIKWPTISLSKKKQEGKHTPEPAETSPQQEGGPLLFFFLNESPYE
jgi:hypothetical protein